MDHARAVLAGKEEPTVKDFIEWQEELSFRLGETGFTMGSWDPTKVFNFWTDLVENETGIDETQVSEDFDENFEFEPNLDQVLEKNHGEITRMQQRMEMMQTNKPLFFKTKFEVQRSLLQAGKTQRDIEKYNEDNTPLRHQIMHLRKLEHPTPPKPQDGVAVFIILGAKAEHKKIINLPIKASFEEVYKLLESIRKSVMLLGDHPATPPAKQKKPVWRYRLIRGRPPLKPMSGPTKLSCDADYRGMIRKITKSGAEPLTAAIQEVTLNEKQLDLNTLIIPVGQSSATTIKRGRTCNPASRGARISG